MTSESPNLPVMTQDGGSRPVPDPTELTDRAIARLRAEMTQYVDGQLAIRDERLKGIDEATRLRLSGIEGVPDQIRQAVTSLELLHDEKFNSIQTQFTERDTRSERESRDNKVAVDAAFAAQKEAAAKQDEANAKAIDKSERATAETIKTNQELNKATTDGLTKSVDEVKLAVASILATKTGATESRTETRAATTDNRSLVFSVLGVGILIAGIAAGFLLR
jgi:cation transport regulator ChaB